MAAHGFDELGVYFYKSRSKWRAYTSLLDLTSSTDLTGLAVAEDVDRAARKIVVPLVIPYAIKQRVFQLSSALSIPGRSTTTLVVTLDEPVIDQTVTFINAVIDGAGVDPNASVYGSHTLPDGNGTFVPLTITATIRGDQATLAIRNDYAEVAYIVGGVLWMKPDGVTPSDFVGRPALTIGGTAVVFGDEFTVTREDTTSPSWDTYTAPGNPWRQGYDPARSLLVDLADELHHPPPTLEDISSVGDPRRQVGDCNTLIDPATGVADPCWILGKRDTYSNGALHSELTVRMVARPGQWLLGVTGRTELGTTTYL